MENTFRLQGLVDYAANDNLEVVGEDREWTPEHGEIVVDAVLAGITPLGFRQTIKFRLGTRGLWTNPTACSRLWGRRGHSKI